MPLGANPTIRPDFTMFRQEEDAEHNDLRGQQFFSHLYQLLLAAEITVKILWGTGWIEAKPLLLLRKRFMRANKW